MSNIQELQELFYEINIELPDHFSVLRSGLSTVDLFRFNGKNNIQLCVVDVNPELMHKYSYVMPLITAKIEEFYPLYNTKLGRELLHRGDFYDK